MKNFTMSYHDNNILVYFSKYGIEATSKKITFMWYSGFNDKMYLFINQHNIVLSEEQFFNKILIKSVIFSNKYSPQLSDSLLDEIVHCNKDFLDRICYFIGL